MGPTFCNRMTILIEPVVWCNVVPVIPEEETHSTIWRGALGPKFSLEILLCFLSDLVWLFLLIYQAGGYDSLHIKGLGRINYRSSCQLFLVTLRAIVMLTHDRSTRSVELIAMKETVLITHKNSHHKSWCKLGLSLIAPWLEWHLTWQGKKGLGG
jgi:hypothetical protein